MVTLYQNGDAYELAIHPTLSSSDFLRHTVYRTLLEKKIGEPAVSDLRQEQADGEPLAVPLSQAFPEIEELASHDETPVKADFKDDLIWSIFVNSWREIISVSKMNSQMS